MATSHQTGRQLLRAVSEQAACNFGCVRDLFEAAWQRTCALWARKQLRGDGDVWETLLDVLQAMQAWGVDQDVLCRDHDREAAASMVSASRCRAELEYGEGSKGAEAWVQMAQRLAVPVARRCPSAAEDGD